MAEAASGPFRKESRHENGMDRLKEFIDTLTNLSFVESLYLDLRSVA